MRIPTRLFSPKNLSLGLGGVVLLWVISGIIFPPSLSEDATQQSPGSSAPAVTVEISPYQAVKHVSVQKLNGVTKASRQLAMKAEVTGKVIKILAVEGTRVTEGTPLVEIETRDRQARLSEAEALVKQRTIENDAAKALGKKGLNAESRIAEAAALLEQARAQLIRARVDAASTQLTAPFDGWLEEVNVEVGDLVGAGVQVGQGTFNDGTNIVTLIDSDPMLAIVQVSENTIGDLKPGHAATAILPNGAEVQGTISYIGSVADPVTRTFRVEVSLPNPTGVITSGTTVSVSIPTREQMAHRLPSSLLSLGEKGEIGIKAVEEGNIVAFHPVTLSDSDTSSLWVTGLPEKLNIITRGQEFVKPGSEVLVKEKALP